MAQINVRNLDDWIVAAFRELAQQHGRSLEAEVRDILRTEALRTRKEIADELRQLREQMAEQYGPLHDSTAVIRAMRDAPS